MAFYDQGGGFLLFLLLRAHGGKRKPVSVAEKVAEKEIGGLGGLRRGQDSTLPGAQPAGRVGG